MLCWYSIIRDTINMRIYERCIWYEHQIDLSAFMDKKRMASSASDLNLQLMAWRHFPELNLPLIKRCRVLLLGCGSLGCFVARQLLAWGFRSV